MTNVFQSYGQFTFSTTSNTIAGVTYQYPNAMANYQMGFMTGFSQGNYELVNDRNHFPGVYAQDSWKATHRLTLNYGLRWEAFAPWTNKIPFQTAFNPANYVANKSTSQFSTLPAGMMLSGDPGMAPNGVYNKYTQFMPRVGFAYDIYGNGKTVIRGGFGIFYQDRLPGFFNLSQASFVPNTTSVALTNLGMMGAAPEPTPAVPSAIPTAPDAPPIPTPIPSPSHYPSPPTTSSPTPSNSASTIPPATSRSPSLMTTTSPWNSSWSQPWRCVSHTSAPAPAISSSISRSTHP